MGDRLFQVPYSALNLMNHAIDITKTAIVYTLGYAMIVVVAFGGAL